MKEKLLEAIEAFEENTDEKLTRPEYSHLFIVKEKSKQIDEEKEKCDIWYWRFYNIYKNNKTLFRKSDIINFQEGVK